MIKREEAIACATAFLQRNGFRVVSTLQGVTWQAETCVVAHLETIWGIFGSNKHWEVVFDLLLSHEDQAKGYDHWVRVHVDSDYGDTWFSPIQ